MVFAKALVIISKSLNTCAGTGLWYEEREKDYAPGKYCLSPATPPTHSVPEMAPEGRTERTPGQHLCLQEQRVPSASTLQPGLTALKGPHLYHGYELGPVHLFLNKGIPSQNMGHLFSLGSRERKKDLWASNWLQIESRCSFQQTSGQGPDGFAQPRSSLEYP